MPPRLVGCDVRQDALQNVAFRTEAWVFRISALQDVLSRPEQLATFSHSLFDLAVISYTPDSLCSVIIRAPYALSLTPSVTL